MPEKEKGKLGVYKLSLKRHVKKGNSTSTKKTRDKNISRFSGFQLQQELNERKSSTYGPSAEFPDSRVDTIHQDSNV